MAPSHSRNASDETMASNSYQLILEHLLQYPGSYEIPLRTMYTLNCAPRAQPLPKSISSRSPSPNDDAPSPVSGQIAWSETSSATASFTSTLMSQISSLPCQPTSLPPSFLTSFIARCFHPCLSLVDFPQALTALDYMRDLDNRRKKEAEEAFKRLEIDPDTVGTEADDVSERFPGVALWVKNIVGKSKKADSYYSTLYLGLRRWIMINELSLSPFNKLNCMGMLNTLFPPQPPGGFPANKLPTAHLTAKHLEEQRHRFFEYIKKVEKYGVIVLSNLVDQNMHDSDDKGWPHVQKILDKYLTIVKSTIEDCQAVSGTDCFKPANERKKKTDSGVSFGSQRRPSAGAKTSEKPLPVQPPDHKLPNKGLSRLERITREFKRMRVKSKPEVEEMVKISKGPEDVKLIGDKKTVKTLKKARSIATLREHNGSHTSLATSSRKGSDIPEFNPELMKKHRKIYDSKNVI